MNLKHFKESEFFAWSGNTKINVFHLMNKDFLLFLDDVRDYVGTEFRLNNSFAFGTGHSSKSYHYKGMAIDFITPHKSYIDTANKIHEYFVKNKLKYGGLGLYPYWHTQGLHLDNGNHKRANKPTYWVRDKTKKYLYSFNYRDITKKIYGS